MTRTNDFADRPTPDNFAEIIRAEMRAESASIYVAMDGQNFCLYSLTPTEHNMFHHFTVDPLKALRSRRWLGFSSYAAFTGRPLVALVGETERAVEDSKRGKIVIERDTTMYEFAADGQRVEHGSLLCIPIMDPATGHCLGVVRCVGVLDNPDANFDCDRDTERFFAFAGDWLPGLLKQCQDQQHLMQAAAELSHHTDKESLLRDVLDKACAWLDADRERSAIYLRVAEKRFKRASGPSKAALEYDLGAEASGSLTEALLRRVLVEHEKGGEHDRLDWSNNIHSDTCRGRLKLARRELEPGTGARAFVGIRLEDKGELFGAIIIKAQRPVFTPFKVGLLVHLADKMIGLLKALEHKGGLFEAVFTAAPWPIVAIDGENQCTDLNDAAAQMLRRDRVELLRSGSDDDESAPVPPSVADAFFEGDDKLAGELSGRLSGEKMGELQTPLLNPMASADGKAGWFAYVMAKSRPGAPPLPVPVSVSAKPRADLLGRSAGTVAFLRPLAPTSETITGFGDWPGSWDKERNADNDVVRSRRLDRVGVTSDEAMLALLRDADLLSELSALLFGPPGAGKELIARHIHFLNFCKQSEAGDRRPFVKLDCTALKPEELESEIFGCVEGQHPNRVVRKGALERANGGTLFLTELAGLPLWLQARLRRALDERVFTPVGASKQVHIQLLLLAATADSRITTPEERAKHADALRKIFDDDLVNRLAMRVLLVPPFRTRRSDILLTAHLYLELEHEVFDSGPIGFDFDAAEILWRYRWPNGMHDMCSIVQTALERWKQDRRKGGRPRLLGLEHMQWTTIEDALALPCAESGLPALSKDQRDEISAKRFELAEAMKGDVKRGDHARDQILRAAYQDPLVMRDLGGGYGSKKELLRIMKKEETPGFRKALRALRVKMCDFSDPDVDQDSDDHDLDDDI